AGPVDARLWTEQERSAGDPAAAAVAGLPWLRPLLEALPAALLVEPDELQARLPYHLRWD
ncbi:MAG: hypothetical protein AAGC55_31585, partial [Myxococcota bacterium]